MIPDKEGWWWCKYNGDIEPREVLMTRKDGRHGLAIMEPYWDTDGMYSDTIFVDDPRLSWLGPVEPPKETPQ